MATAEEYEAALLETARKAIARYPDGVAQLEVERIESPSIFIITITPTNEAAATVSCAYLGDDEATLEFGATHVYLWDDDPRKLAEIVGSFLEPVMAGRFLEAGNRNDGVARLTGRDGREWTAGR